MKKLKFNIPIYDFDITLVQIEEKSDKVKVLSVMKDIKCTQEHMDGVSDYIDRGCYGGGETFYNFDIRAMVIVFYPFRSEESRWEVYSHEKRHIEDRVLQYAHVDDIESAGLLAGYLGRKFYQFVQLVKKG